MKKINWNNVRLVLMLAVVVFLFSFASNRNEKRWFTEAKIEFAENESFITPDKVNKLLIQNYDSVTGIRKDKLDLNNVEKRLDENPMIDKAEVYATVDGKIEAVIRQKKPIARVYEGSKSYYVDYKGTEMPLSENYTARVPLVTGSVKAIGKKQLHYVLKYIFDDDFLKKNIIGIQITPGGSLILKNRNYDYEVDFGRVINADAKFKNYKAFFQDAVKDTLIGSYKTINLKFTQQVVCTKK
ncbi:cell division protein FtsQ/DivIB [Flavobacterium sp. MK4S-17]|uniref:cell division protein FtsQ/DivIB n=1 Tax=Flavobacterium sp. MK4S-17 TaxID=2543737 RepID=UPI00135CC782|nr:cell division protein FtsQ [Flavobacterium sp. MK4S-17]